MEILVKDTLLFFQSIISYFLINLIELVDYLIGQELKISIFLILLSKCLNGSSIFI